MTADYSTLYKENAILKSKIKVLLKRSRNTARRTTRCACAPHSAKAGRRDYSRSQEEERGIFESDGIDIRDRLNEMKANSPRGRPSQIRQGGDAKIHTASQEIIRQHSIFLSKLEELNREVEIPAPTEEGMSGCIYTQHRT
jgi:hypothetical protein